MNVIQRYAYSSRVRGLVAGVYTNLQNIIFTARFNLVVNSVQLYSMFYDVTTGQGIDGVVDFNSAIPESMLHNPGLPVTTYGGELKMSSKSGRGTRMDCFVNVPTGESFTTIINIRLFSVTANTINSEVSVIVGYLCPEDYMSVDAFAAIPG